MKIAGNAKRRDNLATSVKTNMNHALTCPKSWVNRKLWQKMLKN